MTSRNDTYLDPDKRRDEVATALLDAMRTAQCSTIWNGIRRLPEPLRSQVELEWRRQGGH